MLDKKKAIHFVGIGGIGMSGIAYVLAGMGYKVSGSDLELSNLTDKIRDKGGRVFEGHKSSNVTDDTGVLVYSSSISNRNPEMAEAARRKIRIAHRAEILGELFNAMKGIAVTGTHGKTTTTSLVSVMLENLGLDPTVIIGGEVKEFKGNAKLGKGKYLVAEADESDSSFLNLKPLFSIVTNLEMEHVDHYNTLDAAKRSYHAFINNIKEGGTVFYNNDDKNIKDIMKNFKGAKETFGFSKNSGIYPVDIKTDRFNTSFKCVYKNKTLGRLNLKIPGRHNVLNAMAALLVGFKLGFDFKEIAESIKDFSGAKRRFDMRSSTGGVMLIEDYAHHPTEIRAVLDACRSWNPKRVIAIFQPHRYTRTKFLANEFGKCFVGVDKLILTDIYASSEEPIEGVSVKNIYDKVKNSGLKDVVIINKSDIAQTVMKIKKRGDMILVLGAGDIKKVADELADMLKRVKGIEKVIKGKVTFDESLKDKTYFKIGGRTDIWVEPEDAKDLARTLDYLKKEKLPFFLIGNGSNLLAKDEGFKGVIAHLGSPYFKGVDVKKDSIAVGAGFSLSKLVRLCCEKGLGGLESLVGIPGTVGGAIYMNAGGAASPIYKNIGDLVTSLKVMDYNGNTKNLKKEDIEFGYRRSNLGGYIILEARLKLEKADKAELLSRCSKFLKIKREKQALDAPSAGCIFKNPENSQFTCGQMIDMLGLKGRRMGGAEISAKHANFIINKDRAASGDVLKLIDLVKEKVKANYGIDLELEVKII